MIVSTSFVKAIKNLLTEQNIQLPKTRDINEMIDLTVRLFPEYQELESYFEQYIHASHSPSKQGQKTMMQIEKDYEFIQAHKLNWQTLLDARAFEFDQLLKNKTEPQLALKAAQSYYPPLQHL